MKSRKVILDRPLVDSKEIQAHKNFDQVLANHRVMSKPFYKTNWFIGTTGIASVGLIVGGIVATQDANNLSAENQNLVQTDAPPEIVVPDNGLIAMNGKLKNPSALAKKTLAYDNYLRSQQNQIEHDQTSTIETVSESIETIDEEDDNSQITSNESNTYTPTGVEVQNRTGFSRIDLHPRISGKLNGDITREELLNDQGLVTEADVSIVYFELHLVDGLGGKVFEEESNQLNEEMKQAISRVMVGETIYFENIKGRSKNGDVVRLNPLRYVLLN